MKVWNKESPHLEKCYGLWLRLQELKEAECFELDGKSLNIADVISVANHDCIPQLTSRLDILDGLQASVEVLMSHLGQGHYIYGTNTGFGGSADTRTNEVVPLQAALMQITQSGILSSSINGSAPEQAMPGSWVRAAIAVRCNATLRGHTAVSLPILQAVLRLLEHGITPVVPLRGSVSSSGDLMPLSYIAGAIEGSPDILVVNKHGQVVPAAPALEACGILPVALGPKEGLGLINGTASSAALGALVMGHAHSLAVLTQVLTATAVESLHGSVESFHPFIAQVRPHSGQIECARNINRFLQGSQLARHAHRSKSDNNGDLEQDRYSLRSAPQWLGPQIEDLLLADRQILTELNSSCDNPIVDTATGDILYGCNFQAASVTSAMEKTRLGLQMMGRLLFAQLTELADPNLNGGLPASLAADDPSLSFTIKGVEISMASYMAELSYLAGPMSSHIQAAEMHNQSVNSMALASARMSWQAADILSMMSACNLFACCQASDLRALHKSFKDKAVGAILEITWRRFASSMATGAYETLQGALGAELRNSWDRSTRLDLRDRCNQLADDVIPSLLQHVGDSSTTTVLAWKQECGERAFAIWKPMSKAFCATPHTPELLGRGSKRMYHFVREQLGVPFHQGLVEHPTVRNAELDGRAKRTIGSWISKIYVAIRSGAVHEPLMELVQEDS